MLGFDRPRHLVMDKRREAALAESGMVAGNLDDRFGLTLRAIHASMIRAPLGGLQLATVLFGRS